MAGKENQYGGRSGHIGDRTTAIFEMNLPLVDVNTLCKYNVQSTKDPSAREQVEYVISEYVLYNLQVYIHSSSSSLDTPTLQIWKGYEK